MKLLPGYNSSLSPIGADREDKRYYEVPADKTVDEAIEHRSAYPCDSVGRACLAAHLLQLLADQHYDEIGKLHDTFLAAGHDEADFVQLFAQDDPAAVLDGCSKWINNNGLDQDLAGRIGAATKLRRTWSQKHEGGPRIIYLSDQPLEIDFLANLPADGQAGAQRQAYALEADVFDGRDDDSVSAEYQAGLQLDPHNATLAEAWCYHLILTNQPAKVGVTLADMAGTDDRQYFHSCYRLAADLHNRTFHDTGVEWSRLERGMIAEATAHPNSNVVAGEMLLVAAEAGKLDVMNYVANHLGSTFPQTVWRTRDDYFGYFTKPHLGKNDGISAELSAAIDKMQLFSPQPLFCTGPHAEVRERLPYLSLEALFEMRRVADIEAILADYRQAPAFRIDGEDLSQLRLELLDVVGNSPDAYVKVCDRWSSLVPSSYAARAFSIYFRSGIFSNPAADMDRFQKIATDMKAAHAQQPKDPLYYELAIAPGSDLATENKIFNTALAESSKDYGGFYERMAIVLVAAHDPAQTVKSLADERLQAQDPSVYLRIAHAALIASGQQFYDATGFDWPGLKQVIADDLQKPDAIAWDWEAAAAVLANDTEFASSIVSDPRFLNGGQLDDATLRQLRH